MKQCINSITILLLLLTLFVTTSCSTRQSGDDVDETTAGIEVEDSSMMDEENSDVDEQSAEIADSDEEMSDEAQASSSGPSIVENNGEVDRSQLRGSEGEFGTYQVRDGETLMMAAYQVYGDYRKWRDLASINGLSSAQQLKSGQVIKYRQAWENLAVKNAGAPYMIKNGDTLGAISNQHYGTPGKWKSIWDNNKQLIVDPNLIFSGFTIYVMPAGEMAYISDSQMINLN
jgi:nucleoid-associated protein YgaU